MACLKPVPNEYFAGALTSRQIRLEIIITNVRAGLSPEFAWSIICTDMRFLYLNVLLLELWSTFYLSVT